MIPMIKWLLLLLLRAIFLGETWLRARADGARRRCQQLANQILDAVPFPFSLALDWLLPRQKEAAGRVPGPPRTIALVLAEAAPTKAAICSVADVISWCAQSGLTHIFVYDPKGHVKAQQCDLAQKLSKDARATPSYTFSIEAGYPMLAKAGTGPQSKGANAPEVPDLDGQSPRSCASDHCSVSSLSTSPESTPVRRRTGAAFHSVTCAVEVTLLSAEDAHAPLVAAARQGRILSPPPAAGNVASNGNTKRLSSAGSPLPSKLRAAKPNGQRGGGSGKLQEKVPGSSAMIAARPPSRLAAAVAVVKAESSGDLMGFLSMLAAGQTGGNASAQPCAREYSSLPLDGRLTRETSANGRDGACSEASTGNFTLGNGADVRDNPAAAGGVSASGVARGGSSQDLFDGDAEPATWLSANGERSAAEGENWVAKKGSLRWIQQRAGGIEADGGGPIRRRARRGNRARGELGYALLRSPWSWGDGVNVGADKASAAEPDQDAGLFRTVSNGALSHDSDSAFGGDQCDAEQDEGVVHLECSSSAEKVSKGKWFSLSGGQSTEDLLNAFTKNLEAADEPLPHVKASAQRAGGQQANQSLAPAELDKQMTNLAGPAAVREPDLVLVFGRTLTLAGYPPWPIRFSEIYHMGELAVFTRRKLTDALHRYCRTPQRFGT